MSKLSPAQRDTGKAISGEAFPRLLLVSGIISSILYIGIDILATNLYPGYNFAAQAVSELFAIGAPTSSVVVVGFTLSSVCLLAFAVGVWLTAPKRFNAFRLMALMMAANAIDALLLWNFFPMHMRGAEQTLTDTMHAILAINPFVWGTVICGALAFRNWFRRVTILTTIAMAVLAVIAFSYLPNVLSNQPTPWLGLTERASQYIYFLWQVVLAFMLLRRTGLPQPVNHAR
jgi:hypothetical protein